MKPEKSTKSVNEEGKTNHESDLATPKDFKLLLGTMIHTGNSEDVYQREEFLFSKPENKIKIDSGRAGQYHKPQSNLKRKRTCETSNTTDMLDDNKYQYSPVSTANFSEILLGSAGNYIQRSFIKSQSKGSCIFDQFYDNLNPPGGESTIVMKTNNTSIGVTQQVTPQRILPESFREHRDDLMPSLCNKCSSLHTMFKRASSAEICPEDKSEMKNKLLCFANSIIREGASTFASKTSRNFFHDCPKITEIKAIIVGTRNTVAVELERGVQLIEGRMPLVVKDVSFMSAFNINTVYKLLEELYYRGRVQDTTLYDITVRDLKIVTLLTSSKIEDYSFALSDTSALKKAIFNCFDNLRFENHPTDSESRAKFVMNYMKMIMLAKFKQEFHTRHPNRKYGKVFFYQKYGKCGWNKGKSSENAVQRFAVMFESDNLHLHNGISRYPKMRKAIKHIFINFLEEMRIHYYNNKIPPLKAWLSKFDGCHFNELPDALSETVELPPLPGVLRVYLADFYQRCRHILY